MAALTNYFIMINQGKIIHNREDFNKFNKSMNALKYTPYVDMAISLICSIGGVIAAHMALSALGIGLTICACILFISSTSVLRSRSGIEEIASTVNKLWNLKLAYGI